MTLELLVLPIVDGFFHALCYCCLRGIPYHFSLFVVRAEGFYYIYHQTQGLKDPEDT